jgi:hypothetical protein
MNRISSILVIVALLTLGLSAKEEYFNPFEPSKKIEQSDKTSVKKITIAKKWTKQILQRGKDVKVKKRKKRNISKIQEVDLDRIYKKVSAKSNINPKALRSAFTFFKKNKIKKSLSSNYLAIADYTKSAREKRLYIINLKNGKINKHKVAHGKRSGRLGGKVRHSSNRRNTKMTPYGFFKVGSKIGTTKKKNYKYLTVKGLQPSNRKVGYPSRMGGRDIILHPAKYVNRGGRSYGCFAICPKDRYNIFSKLKKALLYSYTGR